MYTLCYNGAFVADRKSVVMDQICRKSAVIYLSQMFIVLAVVIAAIINLSRTKYNNKEMWLSWLCPTIGYALPNLKLRRTDNTQAGAGEQ